MSTPLSSPQLARQKQQEPPPSNKPSLGVGLLFALVIQVIVVIWIVLSEVPGRVFISSWSIVMPGILLLALFALMRFLLPRLFSGDRMLLTYVCISAVACLIGYAGYQLVPATMAWMRFHPEDAGYRTILDLLPSWVTPPNGPLLKGAFYGDGSDNGAFAWLTTLPAWLSTLRMWAPCLLVWGGLSFMFATVMLTLALLLSRSWIREEKLSFPIITLPLEMCQSKAPLLANKIFWIGFGIPLVLESLLALHFYFPTVPAIQLKHVDFTQSFFPDRPWSNGAPWLIGFTPFIVGLAYLAPTDITFSVFFFGLGDRLALVLTSALGWDLPSAGAYVQQMPFLREQNFGAFMVFGGVTLWRWISRYRTRSHESWEPMAMAVIAVGIVGIGLFFNMLGMALWVAFLLVAVILLYAVALSRVRAESGAAWAFGSFGGANYLIVRMLGTSTFAPGTLAALGITSWYSADMRFLPMPFHMEAYKMADSAGWKRPKVAWVLAVASIVGLAVGSVVILRYTYSLGLDTAKVWGGIYWSAIAYADRTNVWLTTPLPMNVQGMQWMGVGAVITLALAFARQQFLWWPFHPVGYVLAHTGTGLSFWSHYGIAWVLKLLILRYGGMRLYQRTLPFVFGVIAGDIITMTLWSAGAVLLGQPVYQFIS